MTVPKLVGAAQHLWSIVIITSNAIATSETGVAGYVKGSLRRCWGSRCRRQYCQGL